MLTEDAAQKALRMTLDATDFPELGAKYEGKVRDNYSSAEGKRFIVVTDRISAFDHVLGTIPFKGQILNRLAAFWFEKTKGAVPNHLLTVPDPNVLECIECEPLLVETVVRSYLTGTTSTSIWTHYERGERVFCGHRLPDGMKKKQKLAEPILTPATKAPKGGVDFLQEIENVQGSQYNDTLKGILIAIQLNVALVTAYINGGGYSDILIGGLGNDNYVVDDMGDIVTEKLSEGADKISSSVTYTLPTNIENLSLTGSSSINGIGNFGNNVIIGNSAINQLRGGNGNDTLDGKAGNNVLTGGIGSDIFRFTTINHIDKITDFSVLDDPVQLENAVFTALVATGTLAADQFRVGTQASDANDFIIYNSTTGELLYDADANGANSAQVIATVGIGLSMTNADIVVI